MAQIFGDVLGYFEQHNFKVKTAAAAFEANFGPFSTIFNSIIWGLFHKTFFFVIYGHFAVNYEIFSIYEQIYGQNLAVTTNP